MDRPTAEALLNLAVTAHHLLPVLQDRGYLSDADIAAIARAGCHGDHHFDGYHQQLRGFSANQIDAQLEKELANAASELAVQLARPTPSPPTVTSH